MAYKFSQRSKRNLEGVHPDLVAVVHRALSICPIDFAVIEGVRTFERQKVLFESGASWTMKSRHLTGHAVDLAAYVDGSISWHWPHYDILAVAMKEAARQLDIPIEWGGDWKTTPDGPHFQLPWKEYSA